MSEVETKGKEAGTESEARVKSKTEAEKLAVVGQIQGSVS